MTSAEKKKPPVRGRPRSFDRAQALERAMAVFWELGYEGATLTDLQQAMGGITAPSFYAAFGSKEDLFLEAVTLYSSTQGAPMRRALDEAPTARDAIFEMLHAAVASFSQRGCPRGCMLVLGALNCAFDNRSVQEHLQKLRLSAQKELRKRLQRGVTDGDLPAGTDIAALTSFYGTVLYGLSIQARDGASRSTLKAAADCAMAAWDNLVLD